VTIDAFAAAGGLAVRSRLAGDSLRPFGLGGRKKLQDVLVDRKVPRNERDRVPIVVDAQDRILWVGGHVVSEDARVTDRTQSVVILKLRRIGEEGDEA
jgi:tRNA(Ile)-lysidine synthase